MRTVLSMRTVLIRILTPVVAIGLVLGVAACSGSSSSSGRGPRIVVTSNVLGDVVDHLVGEQARVETLMPPNVDPHEFSASAKQAADMRSADVLVTIGLGFEQGLADAISAARHDGVTTIAVGPMTPRLRKLGSATDPHVFTDPARFAVAVTGLVAALEKDVPSLDTAAFRARAADYVDQLHALDADVQRILAPIPAARRILVTNHDALGYFADRYQFAVLGAVIPSLSTLAEPSASDLADLAKQIDRSKVPGVFADTSSPTRLAQALAAEGHGVKVVTLYVESLGGKGSGAATYEEMLRTNAERIAATLR